MRVISESLHQIRQILVDVGVLHYILLPFHKLCLLCLVESGCVSKK